jgi:hypothetical protein
MAKSRFDLARIAILGVFATVGVGLVAISPSSAAEQTRAYLYQKFENGDIPTQQDFKDLIDSTLNLLDDGVSRSVVTDLTGFAARLDVGVTVGPDLSFTDSTSIAGLSDDWLGQSGFLALSFLQNSQLHYGYLQMESTPTSTAPYALFVGYLTFEDQANTPLTTSVIPEPNSLVLAAFAGVGLAAWGWRRKR